MTTLTEKTMVSGVIPPQVKFSLKFGSVSFRVCFILAHSLHCPLIFNSCMCDATVIDTDCLDELVRYQILNYYASGLSTVFIFMVFALVSVSARSECVVPYPPSLESATMASPGSRTP